MKRGEFLACMTTLAICGLPFAAYAHATLYSRLGEELPLHLVVDGLYNRMLVDPRTRDRFVDVDLPRLKGQVFTFLAQAAGGPQKFVGQDLRTAHAGMKITDTEWAAMQTALIDTLENCQVARREKREVLSLIESLKGDIVQGP
jgi:hemoglobin